MQTNEMDIQAALTRIEKHIVKTPLINFPELDKELAFTIHLKPEMFQPIRAFKLRGAFNFILKNRSEIPGAGVITHSSGNHGQALAYVAHSLNIPCTIVVPENAPKIKVAAMKKWKATLVFCESTITAREKKCNEIQSEKNALFVPPYDHLDIIEGQGTAFLESANEVEFDFAISPVGGGGLAAGTAIAAHKSNSGVKVYGAEPEKANDAFLGFKNKKRVTQHTPNTMADGLRTTVGETNFPILCKYLTDIFCCSETEIKYWGKKLLLDYNLLIEPSSATVLAAIANQSERFKHKVGMAIISGGNVDPNFYLD